MRVLTLNAGSNSLKFEIVEVLGQRPDAGAGFWGKSLYAGSYDDVGKKSSAFSRLDGKRAQRTEPAAVADHSQAAAALFEHLNGGAASDAGVTSLEDIDCMAHRVVHGADRFGAAERITDEVIEGIEALDELAPLHNRTAVTIIRSALLEASEMPMYAIFDTAFHRDIPREAALYALPSEIAQRHRIRRYGFHGISHQYMALRFAQLIGRPLDTLKLITLHLEGGSSACAIARGRSIDTSMGFTPLEGLMMGTRCGDIDPALVSYLIKKEGWSAADTERFLNKNCGLLGVSKVSADTRELVKLPHDENAALALRMFGYRVRKYVGAYLSALGGADGIVFGGGIGENTAIVRRQVCERLDWCDARLDEHRNGDMIDREGEISASESGIKIWVVPTREGLMMAHLAAARAAGSVEPSALGPARQ